MTRQHYEKGLRDQNGTLLGGSSVRILEPGTTNPIAETLYTDDSTTDALTNPWVTDDGVIDFYLDQSKLVRIGVTRPGGTDETFFEDVQVGSSADLRETITFTLAGAVAVSAGNLRYYIDDPGQILSVRASVGVAPVGADLIVDLNKNGTTIFTDQTTRPRILDGEFTGVVEPASLVTLAAEDYLTLDIDQVGVSTPGTNLVVQVRIQRT